MQCHTRVVPVFFQCFLPLAGSSASPKPLEGPCSASDCLLLPLGLIDEHSNRLGDLHIDLQTICGTQRHSHTVPRVHAARFSVPAGTVSNVVAALDWVAMQAQLPAIVTLSLGISKGASSQSLEQAVSNLIQNYNVTVIAASGKSCHE